MTFNSRYATVLMYHGVTRGGDLNAAAFEEQVAYLKRNATLVSLAESEDATPLPEGPRVALTFDDGFRNNMEIVVPILQRYKAPATFFISSRHATPGAYLWFVYIRALRDHFKSNGFWFSGEFQDMSPDKRHQTLMQLTETLLNLRPHPEAMYMAIEAGLPHLEDFVNSAVIQANYAGMTTEQVAEIADDPLFTIGVHTRDHPLLSRCSREEVRQQILANAEWLEREAGRRPQWIAYPGGDFNPDVISIARSYGMRGGFAVIPQGIGDPAWERPRVGVYSPSIQALKTKIAFKSMFASSWWNKAQSLRRSMRSRCEV